MNTVALRESEEGVRGCKVGWAIRASIGEKTKDFYQRDWEAGQSRKVSGGRNGVESIKKKKNAVFMKQMP